MYEAEDVSFLSDQELWDRLAIYEGLSKVDVLNELSKRLYIRDEYKSAIVLLEEAKQLLLQLKDLAPAATVVEVYAALSFNYSYLKDYENALMNVEESIKISEENQVYITLHQYEVLIDCLENLERFEEAISKLENFSILCETSEKYEELIKSQIRISLNLARLKKFDKAYEMAFKAKEISTIHDEPGQVLYCEYLITKYLYELKDYEQSYEKIMKLIKSYELFDDRDQLIQSKYLFAQILYMKGDFELSEELLEDLAGEYFNTEKESIEMKLLIEKAHVQVLEKLKGKEYREKLRLIQERLKSFEEIVG